MLGEWLTQLPLLLAMTAVAVLPGLPWTLAVVRSRLVAVGISAMVTFGLLPLIAIAWSEFGISWEWWTVLPVLLLVMISGFFFLRRQRIAERQLSLLPVMGAIAAGWLLAALPMLLRANPHDPAQQWDSVFHLNGVWSMVGLGDAHPIGGLREMYGGRRVFYPNTWHAFVTLFSTKTTVIEAANVSSLFLMLLWVLSAAALMRTLSRNQMVILVGTVMSGGLLAMPADALTMYNQWPHAMGAALTPGLLITIVVAMRNFRQGALTAPGFPGIIRGLRSSLPLLPFAALSIIATAGGHPSAVFAAMAVALPAVIGGILDLMVCAYATRRFVVVVAWWAVIVAVIAVPLLALTTPVVEAMSDYPRSGLGWSYAFSRFLTPFPPFQWTWGMAATVTVMATLTLTGAVVIIERQRNTPESDEWKDLGVPIWVIGSFLVMSALTFLAYAPDSEIRTFLLGPWYKDPRRIMAIHGLMMVPLAALGLVALTRLLPAFLRKHRSAQQQSEGADAYVTQRPSQRQESRRVGIVGLVLLLVTVGSALDARFIASDYVYDANNLGKPGMAKPAELAMLRRVPTTLPEDAYVLGDPLTGAAFVEVIGQRRAFFPHLTLTTNDAEAQELFAEHFNEIHTNPAVCQAIRERHITHFYEDADGKYYSFMRSSRHPGFYNVDTSHGFELVDQGDDAKIWRITACD